MFTLTSWNLNVKTNTDDLFYFGKSYLHSKLTHTRTGLIHMCYVATTFHNL